MVFVWYLLFVYFVRHLERFEVVVWLPAEQDVGIGFKLEPLFRHDPEAKNELAYLVSDSFAPLFSILVLSARFERDHDFMSH